MENIRKTIRKKELASMLIVAALFILLQYAFLAVMTRAGEAREKEMLELNMNTMMDAASDVTAKSEAAYANLSDNLKAGIGMMVNYLKEYADEDGYTGPRVFFDGAVAELRDGQVIFPEGYRCLEKQLTPELVEESLKSGDMLTCKVTVDEDLKRILADPRIKEYVTDADSAYYYRSFGEIAPDFVYVDLLSENEYNAYLERCTRIVNNALENTNRSIGGVTLVLRETGGENALISQYGADTAFRSLSSQGLIDRMIREELPVVTMDGQEYNCAYAHLEQGHTTEGPVTCVQMIPKTSLWKENRPRVLLLEFIMLVILTAVTVYITAAQQTMLEGELTDELRTRYSPKRMRKRMVKANILCVVIAFAFVTLTEAVGATYTELRNGRVILNLFSRQLERNNEEEARQIQREEEEWIVYHGEKLALLLSEYPELNTREKLRETAEIIGAETITLFDSRGRQTLSSGDYTGFRLDDEDYPTLYDFRRLLYGVPSIIHETAIDPITDLKRQQIGVTMPLGERDSMHGALSMSLLPERTAKSYDTGDRGILRSVSGTICFAADSTNGLILHSSQPGMIRKHISECGLPEDSLRDSIVDFVTISNTGYLLISSREDNIVCYYAAETQTVFSRTLLVSAVISLIFGATLAMHIAFLMKGYNEENFRKWEALREDEQDRLKERYARMKDKYGVEEDEKKIAIIRRLHELIGWDQRSPGGKAVLVLSVGMFFIILFILQILSKRLLPNESSGTMLSFFMGGRWMRGLNLFSLCGILLLISIACLFNGVCNLLVRLTDNVVSERGETVIRLLHSFVRYVTVIAVMYYGLEYLGFSTGTIIASLGVLSLALSLGAQHLIKDILAGLAIVFDRSFHIGDVVEIGGKEGVVQEIGVRATRLTVSGNNTFYINNSEIRSILNKSNEPSKIVLELRVPANVSLLRIEELLERELPEIGSRNSKIMKGPYLLGVTSLSGGDIRMQRKIIELAVEVVVDQKDGKAVMSYLRREIYLLFQREGIDLV